MDLYNDDYVAAAWGIKDVKGFGIAIVISRDAVWSGEFEYRNNFDDETRRFSILPPQHLSEDKIIQAVSALMEEGCYVIELDDPVQIICVELKTNDIDKLDTAIDIFKKVGILET